MDIYRIEKAFRDYTREFDLTNKHLAGKFEHSHNVAIHSMRIAKSLNLSQKDVELAYTIGLLHDIARFKQMEFTGTFVDSKDFDHGDAGLKVLFHDDIIGGMGIDIEDYETIAFAVKNHNKFDIEKTKDKKHLLHAKIVRDADKLDIFKQLKNKDMAAFDLSFKRRGASKEVTDTLDNHKCVDRDLRKSVLDRALSQLGLAYDLNFDYSKKVYCENYVGSAYENYEGLLGKDEMKILDDYTKKQKEYMEKSFCAVCPTESKTGKILK